MRYCVEVWLVAPGRELPADPGFAYSGEPPIVGCNHVVCDGCGVLVRHVTGRSTTSNMRPVAAELEALYESAAPESSPLLYSRPVDAESRVYFCRCDWYGVELGRAKWVYDLDQDWRCGGHSPAGSGITFRYAVGVNPEFSTASELRDSLLGSYPDAAYFGGPVVGVNRDDTAPAWGWAVDLIRTRSDWWPALGVALQHAFAKGGDLARTAFATLVANHRDSLALLPWTAPVAQAWPDVRAPGSGTGWGLPDFRLEAIIRDQRRSLEVILGGRSEAELFHHGRGGTSITGPFTNEADLRALLAESARAGRFPDGSDGPWSWLGWELLIGEAWLRPALVHAVETIDHADEAVVCALLDWFAEERDLWQFVTLLQGWVAQPPAWWTKPASTRPKGWERTIRSAYWPEVGTLGEVAREALHRGVRQARTPPVLDLEPLYAPRAGSDPVTS